MEDGNGMGETPCDLTKPRIAPYKKYLETSSKYTILVQFKGHSEERIAIFTKHGHMQFFSFTNTPPAVCIEKAVCMKTKEELYQKIRLTPRLPRVVLEANSQCGQQDLRSQDARSSWDAPSESKSYNTEIFELFPKSNAPIAIPTGNSALSIAIVEEIFNLRKRNTEFDKNNYDVSSIPWLCY